MTTTQKPPSVLIVGTGEYVTGYVQGTSSTSDKKVGVVGLVCFDLKRRGLLSNIHIAGTQGTKFPGIREHLKQNVEKVYKNMDTSFISYPADDAVDPKAYLKAMDALEKGDLVMIFTPDDLHYDICKEAIKRSLHILVTKPIVKQLSHHIELLKLAEENKSLVTIEVHKRWDPMYSDARERARGYGNFNFFQSYMSQPKSQLITFKAWAGKSSDISYYLNSHHVDFHDWVMQGVGRVEKVTATASYGICKSEPYSIETEDTITLLAQWSHLKDPKALGTAVYTASWVSPKSDVHSQQWFHYLGSTGEVKIDQAHRGYQINTDQNGTQSINPLYMKYTPDTAGYYSGQNGYGYRSLEDFVVAGTKLKRGEETDPKVFDQSLATIRSTVATTAILEAGRLSLDNHCRPIKIEYDDKGNIKSLKVE